MPEKPTGEKVRSIEIDPKKALLVEGFNHLKQMESSGSSLEKLDKYRNSLYALADQVEK